MTAPAVFKPEGASSFFAPLMSGNSPLLQNRELLAERERLNKLREDFKYNLRVCVS